MADQRFCFPLPDGYADVQAAPLLCAGLIGYRALRMAGDAERLGIYGFGAAAHIVARWPRHQGRARVRLHAPGRQRRAGVRASSWARSGPAARDGPPPEPLDAAIIFAPGRRAGAGGAGGRAKGGTVVCGGIHMSDIPSFPYALLWGERVLRSVANLTRADGVEFLALAPRVPVRTEVETYPLERRTRRWSGCERARSAARR